MTNLHNKAAVVEITIEPPESFGDVVVVIFVATKDTNYVNIHIPYVPGCVGSERKMNFMDCIGHQHDWIGRRNLP